MIEHKFSNICKWNFSKKDATEFC